MSVKLQYMFGCTRFHRTEMNPLTLPTTVQQCYKQAVGGQPPRYAPTPLRPLGADAPRAAPADGNVAVGFHAQYVPTVTAAAA